MIIRLNLLADDDFRADLQEYCRQQLRPLVREMIETLVAKEFEKYLSNHDLSSLVPAALKRAVPDLLRQSWTPLMDAMRVEVRDKFDKAFNEAYLIALRTQVKAMVVAAIQERFK